MRIDVQTPPAALYANGCPVPAMQDNTIGYLVTEYVPALIGRIQSCDADMQGIARWADTTKHPEQSQRHVGY